MLSTIAVSGYRSIRELVMPLGPLTVITGRNGVGKSNLYRALTLLSRMGSDGAIASLAYEGGLRSATWAGPEHVSGRMRRGEVKFEGTVRTGPVSLRLGFAGDDLGYAADLGIPIASRSAFASDPEIKAEAIWHGRVLRPGTVCVERRGPVVRFREQGWRLGQHELATWESVISAIDAETSPQSRELNVTLASWRFYDSLRTDPHAPARLPQIGTRTPVLASDGGDLAAAVQTIREIGAGDGFDYAVEAAFPGSRVIVETADSGQFTVSLKQPGILRPLTARELSDGTLRYLLLAAALHSPRPAPFIVFNEPETSLHPDLLVPLADMFKASCAQSQILVVSHSQALVESLSGPETSHHELIRDHGETLIANQGILDQPAWAWPQR